MKNTKPNKKNFKYSHDTSLDIHKDANQLIKDKHILITVEYTFTFEIQKIESYSKKIF